MITALLGIISTVFGGLLRLAPELMAFFDKKNERKHELDMQDKAMEFEKLRGANRMAEMNVDLEKATLDAIGKVSAAQMQPTGIRWADAINVLVRPAITYFFFALYCGVKIAAIVAVMRAGDNFLAALPQIWNPDADMGMLGTILGFWFVGRVYDKRSAG